MWKYLVVLVGVGVIILGALYVRHHVLENPEQQMVLEAKAYIETLKSVIEEQENRIQTLEREKADLEADNQELRQQKQTLEHALNLKEIRAGEEAD